MSSRTYNNYATCIIITCAIISNIISNIIQLRNKSDRTREVISSSFIDIIINIIIRGGSNDL